MKEGRDAGLVGHTSSEDMHVEFIIVVPVCSN